MGRNHILWALAAPISVAIFVAIPQLVTEVGAVARFVGNLVILGGGAGALVGWAAMRDNDAPRGLVASYSATMVAWFVAFLVWLFAPLSQTNGAAIAFYSALFCALAYCLMGVLALIAWFLTQPRAGGKAGANKGGAKGKKAGRKTGAKKNSRR